MIVGPIVTKPENISLGVEVKIMRWEALVVKMVIVP
jgi:hypothetical protein